MKISLPRPKSAHGRGNHNKGRKRRYGSPTWLHGRIEPSGQTPQSPVKEWADFTEIEKDALRAEILARVK